METPLPSRRITRSQALLSRLENEESNNGLMKSRRNKKVEKHEENNKEKEKSALIDITNGSPIVGLAMGSLKTPSSRCSKNRMVISKNTMTPGSGESLLRGQVKILLQKVEEESVVSKTCFEPNGLKPLIVSPVVESYSFTQMLNEVITAPKQEDKGETVEKDAVTRSLLLDFLEKSHDSGSSECNSLMTCQDSNESIWSVQVNASRSEEHKEYEEVVVDESCEQVHWETYKVCVQQ